MRSPATYSMKKRCITAAAINIIFFIAQSFCVAQFWKEGGDGNMPFFGFDMFMFFTVDSNVFCALACLCLAPLQLKKALRPETRIPKWVILFKFMGTVAVTLTLLVVVVFLGPISGDYFSMFTGGNIHMHLMGPLMAIAGFCFLEDYEYLKKNTKLLPLIPVLIYGCVYAVMVVVLGPDRGWMDFYHFNIDGKWYIAFLAIALVTSLTSIGEFALNQRRFRNVRRA